MALYRIADLEAEGFGVVPTFRTPHVTVAFAGDVRGRLDQFARLRVDLMPNSYHEAGPDPGEEDQ